MKSGQNVADANGSHPRYNSTQGLEKLPWTSTTDKTVIATAHMKCEIDHSFGITTLLKDEIEI